MTSHTAGIIFSTLNDNTVSRLTSERTIAAIPFGARYRLVDFSLSALVNADISDIYVVANYNYRSLVEHIGSGKDWDLARGTGGIRFVLPYEICGTSGAGMYTTHLEALLYMRREYLHEIRQENVVLMDAHTVVASDLRPFLHQHEKTDADLTILVRAADPDLFCKHPRMMLRTAADARVTDIAMSRTRIPENPEVSLGIMVMKTTYLQRLTEQAQAYGHTELTQALLAGCHTARMYVYRYPDWCATVGGFADYYRASMELTSDGRAREELLWRKGCPIYTKARNTTPTVYQSGAVVQDSLIADACSVAGSVRGSILFRGVRIGAGARIRDCVLFEGTHVGAGACLSCIVSDKDVSIGEQVTLSGHAKMPFYIQRGRKI